MTDKEKIGFFEELFTNHLENTRLKVDLLNSCREALTKLKFKANGIKHDAEVAIMREEGSCFSFEPDEKVKKEAEKRLDKNKEYQDLINFELIEKEISKMRLHAMNDVEKIKGEALIEFIKSQFIEMFNIQMKERDAS